MSTNALIIKKLEAIAEILPIPLYWVNTAHVVLGVNKLTVQGMGASCLNEVLGKTPYDLYPEDLAKHIVEHNEKVIKEEVPLSQEEAIQDLQTRRIRYYTAYKSPLRDEHGKVIGLVGSLIEIKEKEAEALKLKTLKEFNILRCLELLAPSFPIPMYWNDLSSVVLGANERTLSAVGISRIDEILGKTPYEMYPSEIAERIVKHNEEVIRIGQILSQEEIIKDIATGRMKYYSAFKSPLRDEDGKIIGTLGTSIEITAEKEADLLRLENARQQVA